MSDPQSVRNTHDSLHARILGTVFVLVLVMYLVAMAVLGLPLTERAQQQLEVGAERELGAIMTAIQDQALLRDYPAIEQAIRARVDRFHTLNVRFAARQVAFEADTPSELHPYPARFATLVDIRAPRAQSELVVGGPAYGGSGDRVRRVQRARQPGIRLAARSARYPADVQSHGRSWQPADRFSGA